MRSWTAKGYIGDDLRMRPKLLNRCMAAVIDLAMFRAVPVLLSASGSNPNRDNNPNMTIARFSFSEKLKWTEPLRGIEGSTDKEIQDKLAIGGLRDAAQSVARLHTVAEFGKNLGAKLTQLLRNNSHWIDSTCDAIGFSDPLVGPPLDAINIMTEIWGFWHKN